MTIVMYFVGLLTGLGIWFIAHWVKGEPKTPKWSVVMTAPMANDIKSRRAPPKPPHNPHK